MADRYDLVIIGMGSGGMIAAEFAATFDLNVAAVERDRVGGDCLWTGCVPSKALLASAKAAHTMRHADKYGIGAVEPKVDTAQVWARIRAVQQRIAGADDNPERYRQLGVDVIFGRATITGPNEVTVADDRRLEARYILLCTGSRPIEPDLPGLHEAGYLTSESVFEIERAPESVVMIGGGPIAIEMAQGFNRLGIRTTVLQKGPGILPRDEPDLVAILQRRLVDEGVDLCLDVDTERVTVEDGKKTVHGTQAGQPKEWTADELLVAVGRRPNVDGLGLEALGVEVGPRGVVVDERLRTNVKSIYAAGDVAGRYPLHPLRRLRGGAGHPRRVLPGQGQGRRAGAVVHVHRPRARPRRADRTARRRSSYGDEVMVWRQDLDHSDRARADGATEGAIVIVTAGKQRIVGAHILAPAAGEMIQELALAIREELKLNQVAGLIHVYPTVSTGIGQLAADAAFESATRYKWLVRKGRR